jgi:hypothetical protein
VIVLYTGYSAACDCEWGGAFLKSAQKSEVVLLGEIQSHKSNSLNLRVFDVLKGQERRDVVKIWGDNGAECRPYVSNFPVGTKWIFALYRVTPDEGKGNYDNHNSASIENKVDYEILICGDYSLKVLGDFAYGNLEGESRNSGFEKVPIGDVKSRVSDFK